MQDSSSAEGQNAYSVVGYIPPPLGNFLAHLRAELIPGCKLRAHVTVLPPRPLAVSEDEARAQLQSAVRNLHPFEVHLSGVQVFPATNVIYLSISTGRKELQMAHQALNRASLAHTEPFGYYPHVTLAQDFAQEGLEDLVEQARKRWADWHLNRGFRLESFAFVRSPAAYVWEDLAEFSLNSRGG
jgi:2'-5' RNA ligase